MWLSFLSGGLWLKAVSHNQTPPSLSLPWFPWKPPATSHGVDAVEATELPAFLKCGADATELLLEHPWQPCHEALQLPC